MDVIPRDRIIGVYTGIGDTMDLALLSARDKKKEASAIAGAPKIQNHEEVISNGVGNLWLCTIVVWYDDLSYLN